MSQIEKLKNEIAQMNKALNNPQMPEAAGNLPSAIFYLDETVLSVSHKYFLINFVFRFVYTCSFFSFLMAPKTTAGEAYRANVKPKKAPGI